MMSLIENQTFDAERALYGSDGLIIKNCAFDGPADGESALKESRRILAEHCFFNLRYPFWHDRELTIRDSELTPLCRAALWYSDQLAITGSKLHGIKALRECRHVNIAECDIRSPEFGWSVEDIRMRRCQAEGEYFMLRAAHLDFSEVRMKGKYSFQYIEDAVFSHCDFDTKDAFWHAKNVTVRDSTLKGEYLAWYADGLTLDHCRIIGTQPLCYCRNLKLIDCEMVDSDLCFERSELEATVTTPLLSIKNPRAGHIYVPGVGQIIADDPLARGEVILTGEKGGEAPSELKSCS